LKNVKSFYVPTCARLELFPKPVFVPGGVVLTATPLGAILGAHRSGAAGGQAMPASGA
jgi:hypothetical protein